MDEKLKQVEQTLAKYGQEQLLDEYNRLTDKKEKQDFLDSILTIDFNQVKTLYENSKEKPSFMDSKIEPIDYTDKSKLSKEEYEKYKAIGEKKIKEGKLADLAPTMLDIMGLEKPAEMTGESLIVKE